MEVHVLASGSKGNMVYIKNSNKNYLVDVGITYSKAKEKFSEFSENIEGLVFDAIFITHEHSDHICGLKTILKNNKIKNVFLTEGTHKSFNKELKELVKDNIMIIKADEEFIIDELKILPLMLSHDAAEPIGLSIKNLDDKKIVILTDTGYVDEDYFTIIENADLYILEANHNPLKLMNSNRPFYIKRRILGESGHLSNEDACWIMNKVVKDKKAIWVVAHISEDCNEILDIEEAIIKSFDDPTKVEIIYSSQTSLKGIKL